MSKREEITKKAKELIKKEGATVSSIARELGVGWHTINRILNPEKEAPRSAPELTEEKTEETRKYLLDTYFKAIKRLKRYPRTDEFPDIGIAVGSAKHHFGNLTKYKAAVQEKYGPQIKEIVMDYDSLFTRTRIEMIEEDVSKYKRFFISSIVSGKDSHKPFMKAIESYCEKNDAKFIGMVCMDVASTKKKNEWHLDPYFRDHHIAAEDVRIHKNFLLSNIKVSAKMIKPTTGLARIGQREGTFVYASPKQFLEFTATDETNTHALMTPGAVTVANYDTDKYMSERTSYIAEHDHVLGGLIVEIDDEDNCHFRQVQAHPDTGSFVDLNVRYFANGGTRKEKCHFIPGDWHSSATEPMVYKCIKELCHELSIYHIFMHDFFDGFSISHHDHGIPGLKAKRNLQGYGALDDEFEQGGDDLNALLEWVQGWVVMVKSNHDEVLDRWLREGRYVNEPQNYRIGHEMALAALDGYDPLEFAYNHYTTIRGKNRIKWLSRRDSFKIGGVELGAHGDLGANGSRGSLDSMEKAYGQCVIGHAHSAAIYRGVWRVGTSSKLQLEYNRGPSSWTHTGCLLREDGSRQLIHFINGRWRA